MIVNRTVFLNSIEPEFLAFRFSQGVDTRVNLHFRDQNGTPHGEDVVAQLQMTGRSNRITEYYSCPATDIVNGSARVLIPAGLQYDPNGWQLRLTGTVDQEPQVIAYGVATAVAGAGPQVEAQDVIDSIDIVMTHDADCVMIVKMWQDDGKNAPFDLTVASLAAAVYDHQGGALLAPFAVTPIDINSVRLTMAAAIVNTLPVSAWWSMTVTQGGGITTIVEGNVSVRAAALGA
jgi:hypothetical protein